ncbi:MAG: mannose-1-phosphate guanylyltransferase/mannose-6-phosphate isomerase [Gammaproteobacteria bacterium]|nr:mannose-1-phosphate guanylyltransferase/mannose-6-phosphate isomerase [Gammaproteobacteria bacterium]
MKLFPIIMAGGSGSRLWPVSRRDYPKQFIALTESNLSLFQLTLKRLYSTSELSSILAPSIIVTNEEYRFIVSRSMDELREDLKKNMGADLPEEPTQDPYTVILEPAAKSTAPAIALAAHFISENYAPDDLMLVLPADAYIKEPEKFVSYVAQAVAYWSEQAATVAADKIPIGTFGVKPLYPHTGYGYVQANPNQASAATAIMRVDKFVEKPDHTTAEKYIQEGNYYWNSGIFLMSAASYIQRLDALAPPMQQATHLAMQKSSKRESFIYPDAASFAACPADSIDYAVMEKDENIFLVPMEISWSDVGSWQSLADLYDTDEQGNSHKGDVVMHDTSDSFVMAAGSRLVTTLGVEGIAVIDTPDAVLVTSKKGNENVRDLVGGLIAAEQSQATEQYRSHRPWGWYESILKGDSDNSASPSASDSNDAHDTPSNTASNNPPALFQVKRLAVYPDAKLSLQSHKHRAEHWVVVQGTALVTIDDEEKTLQANQSIYIPLGAKHRLANPGKCLLVVIEVQSGSYLGEDDIIRYEDIYARS